jgi:hypothetical protein
VKTVRDVLKTVERFLHYLRCWDLCSHPCLFPYLSACCACLCACRSHLSEHGRVALSAADGAVARVQWMALELLLLHLHVQYRCRCCCCIHMSSVDTGCAVTAMHDNCVCCFCAHVLAVLPQPRMVAVVQSKWYEQGSAALAVRYGWVCFHMSGRTASNNLLAVTPQPCVAAAMCNGRSAHVYRL